MSQLGAAVIAIRRAEDATVRKSSRSYKAYIVHWARVITPIVHRDYELRSYRRNNRNKPGVCDPTNCPTAGL